MNIQHLRCLVAAGAAVLVMGLGGNLYATSYPMPDNFGFGTGPPWASTESGFKADFLSNDHGSQYRAANAAVFDHFRQVLAKEAKDWKHFGRSDRSERRVRNPRLQVSTPAVVVPVDTPTSVPDGASTLLLLGGALCGLVVLRRKAQV